MLVPPLGLAYIAAVLEEADYSVRIIDAPAMGFTLPRVKDELRRLHPDIVGVTATTSTFNDALSVSVAAKEACPEAVVAIGGPHVSFLPEQTLKQVPSIDIVGIGEGEQTFLDLVQALDAGKGLEGVRGLAYRDGGVVRKNPPRPLIDDLDKLPFPARHLLPMGKYLAFGRRIIAGGVLTSRGCPFNCIFCSSSLLFGKKFRSRSPENVVKEVEVLHNKYKARDIEFFDDLFTLDRSRAMAICREILDRDLEIRWVCSSRVDTIDRELLNTLKKAGCAMIYLGVESGSQHVLNLIRKGTRVEQSVKAIRLAREAGIATIASFVFGIPGETLEEMKQTIRLAKSLNPDYAQFSIATPYPGTQLYCMAKEQGLIVKDDWSEYTVLKPILATKEFTTNDLEKIILDAYKQFYIRPRYILKHIKEGHMNIVAHALRFLLSSHKLRALNFSQESRSSSAPLGHPT